VTAGPGRGAKRAATRNARSRDPSKALGEQGERTRRRLLGAALVAFGGRGYAATRVDDITRQAGTSHGAFYLYFANKQEVLEALATETAAEMYALADTLEGIEMGEAGFAQLRAWIEAFVDAYQRNAPVVTAWIVAEPEDSRFDKLGREVLANFAGRVAHTISRAVASGARHPVNPGVAATALVAMLERFCYFWLVRGADFHREQVVDTLAAIWHEAIFGASHRS
jgi:AcrR family transcriptional regulator